MRAIAYICVYVIMHAFLLLGFPPPSRPFHDRTYAEPGQQEVNLTVRCRSVHTRTRYEQIYVIPRRCRLHDSHDRPTLGCETKNENRSSCVTRTQCVQRVAALCVVQLRRLDDRRLSGVHYPHIQQPPPPLVHLAFLYYCSTFSIRRAGKRIANRSEFLGKYRRTVSTDLSNFGFVRTSPTASATHKRRLQHIHTTPRTH